MLQLRVLAPLTAWPYGPKRAPDPAKARDPPLTHYLFVTIATPFEWRMPPCAGLHGMFPSRSPPGCAP